MNLQENIFRIKQMMGLLNEQENTLGLTVQEKLANNQRLTPEELNVKGDLALGFSKVKSLPNGLKVGGNLFLNNCDNLTSLPNGLEVGGSLFLMDVKINSLPKRLVVGGSLDLTGSAITSLPRGLKVGGLLKVDNTELIKYPNEKLFKMIGLNGYIKLGIFRNDSNYTADLEAPSNNHNNQELPWEKQTLSDTTQTTPLAQQTPTQTEKVIEVVRDSFTANDCDELHAFEGTGGKKVGEMQTKMFKKLNDIYQKGINPKVSNVTVTVNGMTVTWTCTIVESTDGKAWVGFTSRGAGCNNNIIARANAEYLTDEKTGESIYVGNDVGTMRKRIEEVYKEPIIEIEDVNDFIYNGGGNSFRQIFYRYTKPKSSPPHKSKPITPNPVIPNPQTQPTTGTQTATTGGGAATSTNNNNDELNNLVTSGITDTGVVAPFTDRPYISSGNIIYNQRKQSSTLQSNPNLRRPWGDPYIYYSATTGDIYYYLCGKRRDQAGMPVVPCPKLTSSDWIKSNTSTRTNAIKTNIFKRI